MKYQVYSLRDTAAEVFGRPIFARARGEVVRDLQSEVNRVPAAGQPDNLLNRYPGQFDLYHLGLFDDHDGSMQFVSPQLVCNCVSLVSPVSSEFVAQS